MSGPSTKWAGPLVVVGDVVTDVVCRTDGPWRIGTDTPATVEIRPGGSAANTAAWAAVAGGAEIAVALIGRVGPDDATWHHQALTSVGVDAQLIVDPHSTTTRLVALIDQHSGERTMLTDRGAGLALDPKELDEDAFARAGWVHLSGYLLFADGPRRAFRQIVSWCATHNVAWSVDPASVGFLADLGSVPARELLRGAAVGFPNADEARFLAGLDPDADVEDAAVALCDLFETVVVTCGADGALVARGGSLVDRHEPEPVPALVDAVGAGDAFAGAWLATLGSGGTTLDCLSAATLYAAAALGRSGGRPAALAP